MFLRIFDPMIRRVSTGNNACIVLTLTPYITVAQMTPILLTFPPRSTVSPVIQRKTTSAVSSDARAIWTWSTRFTSIWLTGMSQLRFKPDSIRLQTALRKTFHTRQRTSAAVSTRYGFLLPRNQWNGVVRAKEWGIYIVKAIILHLTGELIKLW